MDIHEFVGKYTIRSGCGAGPLIKENQTLYVGTDTHEDPPPAAGQVGVSIYDGEVRVFPAPAEVPALFSFESDHLGWQGEQLYVEISLYQRLTTGEPYKAPYGLVVAGDPEQVGSWGADNQP